MKTKTFTEHLLASKTYTTGRLGQREGEWVGDLGFGEEL